MTSLPTRAPLRDSLDALFCPRSIAIVGASTNPGKLSGRPLGNLLRSRFNGKVYVVNPRVEQIDGVRSYPSISAIGEPVDAVLIVLPAELAVDAASEAADAGVRVAIVGVSGFAESGDDRGRELQDRLTAITDRTGMRIIGPNTNGVYNAVAGISLGYNSAHGEDIDGGPISIVSHSGAMLSVFAARLRQARVGLAKFVAVGNESDLDMLDYVEYLVDDHDTRVIALLMEALADGERFKRLARRATAAGKRIVVLKLGQSAEGAKATAAHSSRLAGSARSYEALFAQLGVASVNTPEALVAAAALAARSESATAVGSSLGVITYSGAASSIAADSAAASGVPLATFAIKTMATLGAVPRSAPITNPLDIGGVGGVEHSMTVFGAISADPDVRLVLVLAHVLQTAEQRRAVFDALASSHEASGKTHVVLAPGGLTEDEVSWLQEIDLPYYTDTAVAFAALTAYWRWADASDRGSPGEPEANATHPKLAELAEHSAGPVLSEHDSLAVLDAAGVPTVERHVVAHLDDAVTAAGKLGYPVVLKAVVEGVAHKSDLGLVHVGIASDVDLEAAAARLRANPHADAASGFLVERMLGADLEIIAGVTREPDLGLFLVFGLGGILAEAMDSVSLVPLPASRDQISAQLERSQLGSLLGSERWRHPGTTSQLLDALTALAKFAAAARDHLDAIDVNPIAISADGIAAVDALVILTSGADS